MGKKSRFKKSQNKKRSSLQQHQKVGKTLLPPMLKSPLGEKLEFQSWVDDRLPEMLWACLIISVIPRKEALQIFEKIANLGFDYRDSKIEEVSMDITHSFMIKIPKDFFYKLINIVTYHPLGRIALRPLLLIESLPNLEYWKNALNVQPQDCDWEILSKAVATTLNHQSQETTDVRWLTVMFQAALGKISIPKEMEQKMQNIIHYPECSNLSAVMPTIRTMESAVRDFAKFGKNPINWSNAFWQECSEKTSCIPTQLSPIRKTESDIENILKNVHTYQLLLLKHFCSTVSTTAVDAKHDTVFGFGLYALTLFRELFRGNNRESLTGRLILRSLVECRITLAYLLSQNKVDLWKKFRKYGAGQAKLSLLHFDKEDKKPSFVNEFILERIASEDIYQEFLPIQIGNWCDQDLRKMAEVSNTKDDYDKYYHWTSTYIHGNWAAIRDTCFATCHNPLHRLHRTPVLGYKLIEDVARDGMIMVNKILAGINTFYPGLKANISMDVT